MSTEAQAQISVYIAGIGNLGVFEVASGRTAGGTVVKYTPGGQAEEVVVGGRKTREDITVNRVKLLPRDPDLLAQLDRYRSNAKMKITEQPMDPDYNPSGSPIVWEGIFQEYTWPDVDSESDDPARLQLVMVAGKLAA